MLGKQLTTVLAISVLALAGGLGYATFTSTVTVAGSAQAGTLALGFAGSPYLSSGTTSPTGAGTCYFSGTGGSTTLTVTNMAPGDTCSATITLENSGSLPTASETTTISGTQLCTGSFNYNCFVVTDSLGLNSYYATNGAGGPIASGGTYGYSVTVTLASGSTQQSESGTFTISVTGSVGS